MPKKKSDRTRLSVRIPKELRVALELRARDEHVKLSAHVVSILWGAIDKRGR